MATSVIKWLSDRQRKPYCLVAEKARVEGCIAEAHVEHRPANRRPWLVEVTVDCGGRAKWTHKKDYLGLPAAMNDYLQRRDRATRLLERYVDKV